MRKNVLALLLLVLVLTPHVISAQDAFVYAYVAQDETPLYLEPDLNAERFPNHLRDAAWHRSVGRSYVMGGAIVRGHLINEEWLQVVPFSSDAAGPYNWATIYIHASNLEFINSENWQPLYDEPLTAPRTIIVEVQDRRVTLMEGNEAMFKTPVVLNAKLPDFGTGFIDGTPRGMFLVSQTTISRDMPGFPAVGWAGLLTGTVNGYEIQRHGYWFHSSAWFDWNAYGESDLVANETGGCISIPAWEVEIDGQIWRSDVYFFRWLGGQPNAATHVRSYLPEVIRVIIIDDADDIWSHTGALRYVGIDTETYIESWQSLPDTAPPSFFAATQASP